MANIYELTNDFMELQEMIESGEYDLDVLLDTVEIIDYEIEKKAEGYAKIIKNIESTVAGINNEINRLKNRKKSLMTSCDKLKSNLKEAMTITGKTNFKTDLFSFNIAKNGGKLPLAIYCEDEELEDEFVITKRIVDKEAIRKYLDNGNESDMFGYCERGTSLRIK